MEGAELLYGEKAPANLSGFTLYLDIGVRHWCFVGGSIFYFSFVGFVKLTVLDSFFVSFRKVFFKDLKITKFS